MALVYFSIKWCLYGFYFAAFYRYFQITTHSAIRANGIYFFIYFNRFGFKNIRDSRRRTSLGTCSATNTIRQSKGGFLTFYNMAVKAASCHAQYKLSLNFITSSNASETVDAFTHIRSHVRMA